MRVFFSCGYYHTRKKPFLQKAKKPFSNPNQIRCKRFGDHGKKGASRFYKVRVLSHFGKKGARCRDQPYGGGFFGRWRSSDLRSAKKATPYSLSAPQRLSERRTGCDRPRAQTTGETGARSSPRQRRPAKGRPICLASSSPRMRGRTRTATASNACRRRRGCRPA